MVTIDLYDTRGGNWGWFSADDFVIPVQGSVGRMEMRQAPSRREMCHTNQRFHYIQNVFSKKLRKQTSKALRRIERGGSESLV